MFQAVYSWATVPTDLLDGWMASGMDAVKGALPDTWWRSLIVDGVLAGLAGILIFLPQIMILFGFTAVLEHSGAMARLGYVGDRFLRKLDLAAEVPWPRGEIGVRRPSGHGGTRFPTEGNDCSPFW